LHNYAKFVLGVLLYFSLVNCVRARWQARLVLRGLIVSGGLAAGVALLLWAMGDALALRLLVSLGRLGYPTEGRVLRYVEDDPDGLERAIGLSVDPNSFGGMLALVLALSAAQLVAQKPLLRRWLLGCIVGAMALALLLTFSRAALFGTVIAAAYLATVRYRRLWWVMGGAALVGALLLLGLGYAEAFADRVIGMVRRLAERAAPARRGASQLGARVSGRSGGGSGGGPGGSLLLQHRVQPYGRPFLGRGGPGGRHRRAAGDGDGVEQGSGFSSFRSTFAASALRFDPLPFSDAAQDRGAH
jgi:hypothetical protein